MTSSGGNNNPLTFPEEFLFDGTNYFMFKDRVNLAAKLRGAEGYLNRTIPMPTPKSTTTPTATTTTPQATEWWDSSPSYQKWQAWNAWTLALIVYNTKNPIGLGINMSHSAAKVWSTLKDAYGTASDLGANLAENALRAIKYSDGMDFQEHITNLQSKWNIAIDKGAEIKDNQFKAIVILSLPASWDYIIASLQLTKTSIELIAELNVHWERLKERASSSPTSNALLAKAPQPQKRLVCTNPNCGRMGHMVENCYWKGGGKEGQFPTNFGQKRNATQSQSTPQTNQQNPTANIATTTAPANQTTYALMVDLLFTPAAIYD